MADPRQQSQRPVSTEELLAAAGIEVTDEGKARARRKLDEHAQAMTPDRWNALRAQVGLPPKTSAA